MAAACVKRRCQDFDSQAKTGVTMGKQYEEISPALREWISKQHMFFVATAPNSADGLINCSPKGLDTFRVLSPREVAYLDLTGSGVETAAHLGENGRIVFMFCAFDGPPRIVRLHGAGEYCRPGSAGFAQIAPEFPALPGIRGVVRARVSRVSDSCGYSVPRLDFREDRDTLLKWAEKKGADELKRYHDSRNARSIDGLPGLPSL